MKVFFYSILHLFAPSRALDMMCDLTLQFPDRFIKCKHMEGSTNNYLGLVQIFVTICAQ